MSLALLFKIPMDLLTTPFPNGLNLSFQCCNWMPYLGIYDWKDLKFVSPRFTVEILMHVLSVDYYYRYKNDMRIFLTLGSMFSMHTPSTTTPEMTTCSWIPSLMKLLRMNLITQVFYTDEKYASQKIFTENVSPVAVKRGGLGMVDSPI